MFKEELKRLIITISSVVNNPYELVNALKKAIEWAKDRVSRLNQHIKDAESDFLQNKAEFELPTRESEKPRILNEQTGWAKFCKWAGFAGIFLELLLATKSFFDYFYEILENSYWLSLFYAISFSTIITIAIAALFHISVFFTVKYWGNSRKTLKRLTYFFILPSFFFTLISIAVWVALQRLNTDEVVILTSILPIAKVTAMLSLMFLGSSLLVASHLLNWSQKAFWSYENLLSEKQEIEDQRRAWQEKLDEINLDKNEGGTLSGSNQQNPATEITSEKSAASLNGKSGNLSPVATTLTLVLALVTFFGVACQTQEARNYGFKKIEIKNNNQIKIVSDNTGIENKEAYEEAAKNVIATLPKIVKKLKISNASLYQFGKNARIAKETKEFAFLPVVKYESLASESKSDLEKIRPDVAKKKEEEKQKALLKVNNDAETENDKSVDEVLKSLTIKEIVASGRTDKTDLNGTIARFGNPSSTEYQEITVFLTDGHQNLNTEEIINIIPSKNNVAIVFILIPETNNSDIADYEQTKAKIKKACPWAIVVPHYQKDLDKVVDEAVEESRKFTAPSN